mgnify:CR=1 FL=1
MIGKSSKSQEPYKDISNLTQADIAAYYLNIKSIPSLIHSPLRQDRHPSFALYCPIGTEVNYRDFSTGESGTIWSLLMKMWSCNYREAVDKVYNDLGNKSYNTKIGIGSFMTRHCKINNSIDLKCKVREWKDYDIEYWNSYGISLKWLKYADVYPISHKIIVKDDISYAFKADKYAYTYVEFKEGKVTLKIYQPFNKNGFKWSNRHDKSVISLWTKVPNKGEKICICSSLKDALCLWANTNIPSLAIQGEGYGMSDTAINELKRRFNKVYICLDNDEAGLKDALHLANKTGFINIILPPFKGGKDISDYYKILSNKEQFKQTILSLFV